MSQICTLFPHLPPPPHTHTPWIQGWGSLSLYHGKHVPMSFLHHVLLPFFLTWFVQLATQEGVPLWSSLPRGRTPGMLLRLRLHWPYLPLKFQGSAATSLSWSINIGRVQQRVVWGSPQATTFQMSYPCMVQRLQKQAMIVWH